MPVAWAAGVWSCRPPGAGEGERGAEAPAGLATTAAPVASAPAGPARAFPPPAPGGGLSWAPGARDHRRPLSLLCLIRPDRGGHVRPGRPAGRRGRQGKGREAGRKRGGSGGRRKERGADSAAVGGGGGGRGRERIARSWIEEVEEEGTGAGVGERSAAEAGDGGRAGGWPPAGAGAAAAAAEKTAAREAHPASPAAARFCALGRPAGAGRRDGAAARAPRARRLQPGLRGTGGYSARAHPLPLLRCPPPLPGRVPFRKWPGMRSPAASQPGQRFLRCWGSSSRAARSAFVPPAAALPEGPPANR